MISVIITSYNEPETIGRAINAFVPQLPSGSELLVVCPDEATRQVVIDYAKETSSIQHIQDDQHGKPNALNIGLTHAKYDLVVLTDGDVFVAEDALKWLLAPFENPLVGAVTARPISTSSRKTMLGYWSHLLTDGAHHTRQQRAQNGDFLLCSGYLFAYRKALMPVIPPDALAEDAVISHRIAEQGYHIAYAPESHVFVKYPSTYADWLIQKVRSAGGYAQSYITQSPVQMRSARLEIRDGSGFALRYGTTFQERWWTLLLFMARLHLWLLVYWRVKIRKNSLKTLWQRVNTTK